jgi:IS5 family transposase
MAPWRVLFSKRLGRPSVPVDTLLRLLYLKHRYGLGYESLCREVADSIGWRRFCRIGLDRPVPHPSKLVRRAGPEVIGQLNQALVTKLAADKLLRARKLRVDTTVVEADIDYPTDADLLEQAVRKVGLSPQRPLYRVYQQNPRRAGRRRRIPAIRAQAAEVGATTYSADEAGVRSDDHAGTTGAPVGRTLMAATSGDGLGST